MIIRNIESLKHRFNPSKVRIQLNHPEPDFNLKSDPVLAEYIVRNIIHNAIRFTLEGSVTVNCYPEDHHYYIEVSDT